MSFKIKKILNNPYVFSIISKVCVVILGFLYSVCQSRYLGSALKGDVAYISSITSISSIVFGCGIHQAYPYFKKKTGKNVAPFFLKLSIMMLGLYFVIALALVLALDADISLGAILILTPCLVYNKIVAYISMVENPNKKNLTEMLANLLEVVTVVLLWILLPPTLLIGVFIFVIKDVFLAIVFTYRLRDYLFESTQVSLSHCLEVLKFGVFPMLVLLMTTLNYRIDVIMLKHSLTSEEVGIYSVGVMLAERVWLIPDALKEVMISNLSKGKGTDEVSFVIRVCNSACIIVVIGIIALGQPFINLFYGLEYSAAYSVTVVILIGVIFMIYYKLIAAYNIVQGKQKENFIYLVISVICNIAANAILIPIYGNIGAAIASIFSYGISAFLFTNHFVKETGIQIRDMLLINKKDITRLKSQLSSKR